MVRAFLRSMLQFCAAALLLVTLLCAVEVALRAQRFRGAALRSATADVALIAPDAATWIDVQPFLNLQRRDADGALARLQTSEAGLRSESPAVPKPRGVFRILCLGAETVFGADVDGEATLPALLQRELSAAGMRVEVINGGCPQAGPLVQFLRYRQRLMILQPDLILYCLTPDDIRFDEPVRGALRLDQGQQPAYAPHPAAVGEKTLVDEVCREFATVDWLMNRVGVAAGLRTPSSPRAVTELSDPALALAPCIPLHHLAATHFGALRVCLLPSVSSLDAPSESAAEDEVLVSNFRQLVVRLHLGDSLQIVNLASEFRTLPEARGALSVQTGLLNATGYRWAAQRLARDVQRNVSGGRTIRDVPSAAPPATLRGPERSLAPHEETAAPVAPSGLAPYSTPAAPQLRPIPFPAQTDASSRIPTEWEARP